MGYNDQRFWCPSVLVAQHHLDIDKLQPVGFFDCFVLDLDRPDTMTLIWCGDSKWLRASFFPKLRNIVSECFYGPHPNSSP